MAAKEKYKEDTWYDAPTRRGRRQFHAESSKQSDVKPTKFFVSNLPGGCSSADLVEVMKGFGVIHNTYIARKFDKLGKRFGFVSFVNVRDPLGLESQLKDVWIGSYKLYIVLARFVDGEKVDWSGEKHRGSVPKEKERPVNIGGEESRERVVDNIILEPSKGDGRTFRETLLNLEPEKKMMEFKVKNDYKGGLLWDGCGSIGKLADFQKLSKLRVWLDLLGYSKVGIRYVGGLWVVLIFESDVCMGEFLRASAMWNVTPQKPVSLNYAIRRD